MTALPIRNDIPTLALFLFICFILKKEKKNSLLF